MGTPGVGQMLIGGAICVVGLGVTVVTAAGASGGGRYVVAWGAILVGAIQLIRGLITFVNYEPQPQRTQSAPAPAPPPGARPPAGPGTAVQQAPAAATLPSNGPKTALMGALAASVHDLKAPSQNEIRAIQSALIEAGQSAPTKKDVAAIVEAGRRETQDILVWLKGLAPSLDPQAKAHIVRGCFSVMLSDIVRPYAMPTAQKVAGALGMSPEQASDVLRGMTAPLDGKPIQIALGVSPAEAENGKRAELSYWTLAACTPCGGRGCDVCSETGRVRSERRLIITTPAGLKDGEQLRCDGDGESPLPGGRPGDLYIRIKVEPAPAA